MSAMSRQTAAARTRWSSPAAAARARSAEWARPSSNFQTLAVDAGATWTLTGTNTAATVLDNGTLNIAGSLVVSSAINPASTGLFQIQAGAKLETAADTGTNTQINFLGSSQLTIDSVASFGTNVGTSSYAGPLLEDFVNGDKIDLKQYSSTGASFSYNASTGVLQMSNSSGKQASLDFQTFESRQRELPVFKRRRGRHFRHDGGG